MLLLKEYNQNLKLLKEYSNFEYDKPLLETHKRKDGKYIMRGMFMQAEIVNQNGRIYPREILEREVNNYQKWIRERKSVGTLDHEDSTVINLREVSHLVTEMYMDTDNNVYGKLEILDTPNGKITKTLIDSDIKLGVSSRGIGETEPQGDYEKVINYTLLAADLVQDASAGRCFIMRENNILSRENFKNIKNLFTKDDRIDRILNEIL